MPSTPRTTVRTLPLSEYQSLLGVELTETEVLAIRQLGKALTVSRSLDVPGYFDLTATSWVGVVNLETLSIEIRPKVSTDQLLFMISYSLDRPGLCLSQAELQRDDTLVEAIALAFAIFVQRAVRRGLLQGYQIEEAALPVVRGRIRFDEQIRRHYAQVPPIEVRYDEFTVDILENRLIKAALVRLGNMHLRSARTRRTLGILAQAFAAVQASHFDSRNIPDVAFTRLNEQYRPAINLAKLILRATSYELRHGNLSSMALLVDMNQVFEDFVVTALRESLRLSPRAFPQESRGHSLRLDQAGDIHLYPDISWWDGHHCRFVGDVKYKRIDSAGAKNSDVYQVLAYAVATNLPGGLLIYAAGEAEDTTHEIVHLGKRIEVNALDLSGKPEDMLEQMMSIARRIRAIADQSSTFAS